MAYPLTTAAVKLIDTATPRTYYLHAAKANTDNLKLGDSADLVDFEELGPGDSIEYKDFIGTVWVAAASGTQTLEIPFKSYSGTVYKQA